MTAAQIILVVAVANDIVWALVILLTVRLRRRYGRAPNAVVASFVVAVIAVTFGGTVVALSYVSVPLLKDLTDTLAGAWRGAMLVAGLYGLYSAIGATHSGEDRQ